MWVSCPEHYGPDDRLRMFQTYDEQNGEMPRFRNVHVPNTGRLLFSHKLPPEGTTGSTFLPDSTARHYDAAATCRAGTSRWAGSAPAATR